MQVASVSAHTGDLDLVARHAYGDPEAFDEIYGRYGTMVYQLALRMSGDPVLAEDLSQDVFVRVFRHLGKFRGKSSLKTWVYRVALNCCRSRLSRKTRRARPFVDVEDETFESVPSPREGTDARVVRRETGELLETALAQLPVAFREAVVLRDICDLAYDEIAQVLDVRIGTVRSRIARGRDRLRRELSGGEAEHV